MHIPAEEIRKPSAVKPLHPVQRTVSPQPVSCRAKHSHFLIVQDGEALQVVTAEIDRLQQTLDRTTRKYEGIIASLKDENSLLHSKLSSMQEETSKSIESVREIADKYQFF